VGVGGGGGGGGTGVPECVLLSEVRMVTGCFSIVNLRDSIFKSFFRFRSSVAKTEAFCKPSQVVLHVPFLPS